MNVIIRWVVGLISVVLVYVVINIFLVGGQKLWHYGDQKRLDELKEILNTEKVNIESLEKELKNMEQCLDTYTIRINKLKSDIQLIENRYPRGIPSNIYNNYIQLINDYNSLVDTYNSTLNKYNSKYEDYSHQIDKYNAMVVEANNLAKKIGTTWYVVPVPIPGVKTHEGVTKPATIPAH